MKRIIISVLAILSFLPAQAQYKRFIIEPVALFQTGRLVMDEGETLHNTMFGGGIYVRVDPIFPLPLYVETGLDILGTIVSKEDDRTPNGCFRFEIPLNLTIQWEPSPAFSIGPYGGIYGALNHLVREDFRDRFNQWQWGFQAGACILPGPVKITVTYYKDMVRFNKSAEGQDGIRIGAGLCF